jgi:thiamine transport system substrate-binding protein
MANRRIPKFAYILSALSLTATLVSGCATNEPVATETQAPSKVTLVTHESFAMSEELVAEFEAESGFKLEIIKAGDAGTMTNKLVLTKDDPIGDVVYGIDNTFASVATENQVIAGELAPIDFADVCFNFDKNWFSKNETVPPTSIFDLTKPQYRGLTVVTNPNTSSPGLSMLAATVSLFGEDGFEPFWQALKNNDVKVAAGWEDAYFTDFSGSSGKGDFPIVLSYSSSPAFEIRENGESQTQAILDGCFRQTEYAGALANASNPAGAAALVKFMQGKAFQSALPDAMYVYPIDSSIELPAAWAEWAPAASKSLGTELDIAKNRKDWLKKWSEIF